MSRFITICLLAFCYTNSIQAFEGNNNNHYNYDEQLLDYQQVEQVITNEQGVFLLIDGCWIGAQGMQATQDGIFVLENGEWISLFEAKNCNKNYVWRCPICGTWNVQNGLPCSNSRNHPK